MLISVCMITFNQEAFVAQALESAIAQEGPFDLEIVVSDDASSDSTPEIVAALGERSNVPIRLMRRRRNVGYLRNFFETAGRCRGDYLAFLEGDDYWCDDRKLAKQLEILESSPDCVGSFHDCWILDQQTGEKRLRIGDRRIDTRADLPSLVREKNMATASMVMRNTLDWERLPRWTLEVPQGDYSVALLAAERGRWCYLAEAMAVYRSHPGGAWGALAVEQRLARDEGLLAHLQRQWSDPEVRKAIEWKRRAIWRMRAMDRAKKGRLGSSLVCLLRSGWLGAAGSERLAWRRYLGAFRVGVGRRMAALRRRDGERPVGS